MRISKPTKSAKPKNRGKMQGEDTVDHSRISSSSISSSDSEAGLITNDEDREGMLDLKISFGLLKYNGHIKTEYYTN